MQARGGKGHHSAGGCEAGKDAQVGIGGGGVEVRTGRQVGSRRGVAKGSILQEAVKHVQDRRLKGAQVRVVGGVGTGVSLGHSPFPFIPFPPPSAPSLCCCLHPILPPQLLLSVAIGSRQSDSCSLPAQHSEGAGGTGCRRPHPVAPVASLCCLPSPPLACPPSSLLTLTC